MFLEVFEEFGVRAIGVILKECFKITLKGLLVDFLRVFEEPFNSTWSDFLK